MFEFIKMGYRDLVRNKRRSLLTALAIFFASMISVLTLGFSTGLIQPLIHDFAVYGNGDIRITTTKFAEKSENYPIYYSFKYLPVKNFVMDKYKGYVEGVYQRVKTFAISVFGKKVEYYLIIGVERNDPLRLSEKIVDGSYMGSNEVIIGEDFAKANNLKVGDYLFIISRNTSGGLSAIKPRISGIFKTKVIEYDKNSVIMNVEDVKRFLRIPSDETTELLIFFNIPNLDKMLKVSEKLKEDVEREFKGLKVSCIPELMGELLFDMIKAFDWIAYLIVIFILFLASLVIINTMLVVVFERIREVGILKALGMTDTEVVNLFLIEGGLLGLIGGVPGSVLGYLSLLYFAKYGLNYKELLESTIEDFPMEYVFKPTASIEYLLLTIIFAVIISMLITLIPSNYARKLTPVEAMRR